MREFFAESTTFYRASGFEDACERVADGACNACLLPTHDADGARILRTEKLCVEYGLKKRMELLCEEDEERATYGLFSRELTVCETPDFAGISVPGGEENAALLALLCEKTGFLPWLSPRGGRIAVQTAPKNAESLWALFAAAKLLFDDASLDAFGKTYYI